MFKSLYILALGSWSLTSYAACTDTNPPSIFCSTNIVTYASPGQCAKAVSFSVTATNRCDPSPVVTCNPPSGSSFPVGKTTVSCSARDATGNSNTCSFNVTVFPSEVAPNIQWQQSFGGSEDDYLVSIQQTIDGGYILGGTSYSASSGNKTSPANGAGDYWVLRLDAAGNKLWEQSYGGSGDEVLFSLQQTTDGGFILAGMSSSGADGTKTSPNYGGYDYWIVRLDALGNQIWDQDFGGSDDDGTAGVFVRQTSDGGFILGGDSRSGATGSKISVNYGGADFWVLRLDASGNELWDQSFGGANNDTLQALQQTSDGGFILGGSSDSAPSGNKTSTSYGGSDFWVVRLNSSGTKVWEQSIGGSAPDQLRSLQTTTDGGFILGGSSSSSASGNKASSNFGSSDFWAVRLDASGNKVWDQTFGGSGSDEIRNIQQTTDSGYILGGASSSPPGGNKTSSNFGGNDYWVVRVDSTGSKLWEFAFGGTGGDNLYSLKPTRDGGYILGGYSSSGSSGNKTTPNYGGADFWITKLAPSLPVINCPTGIVAEATSSNGAIVSFTATATNICQPAVPVVCVPSPGSLFHLGTNLVICTATDTFGATNQRVFNIIVGDTTAPVLNCLGDITTNAPAGQCSLQVNLGTPAATDAGGPVTLISNAPSPFPFGVTKVTWTASDPSGNTTVCTQTVTVASQPPSITCPGDMALIAPAGQCYLPVNFAVLASDNCDPAPVVTCIPPSGSLFPIGKTSVNCMVRNAAGTTATCTFVVSVYPITTSPPIQWQKSYGGDGEDALQALQQTSDGGFILGGHSLSSATGNKATANFGSRDFWVVRTDPTGSKLWEQNFGGSGDDTFTSLQIVGQSGYILGGTSSSGVSGNKTSGNNGVYDFWIVRLDNAGNKIWDKNFGGNDNDYLYSVQPTTDGGFILGGWSLSLPSGNKSSVNFGSADFWVVRLDSSGNKLWDQSFGGIAFDSLYSLIQTRDGGFLLGGISSSPPGGNKTSPNYGNADFWVVRLDVDGNKLWDQSYGGSGDDALFSVQQTTDGGFILAGYSASGADGTKTSPTSGDNDYWVVRIDASGNQLWDKSFGGFGTDGFPNNPKIQPTRDGGFLLGGQSGSTPSGNKTSANYGSYDYWVMHLDSNGNVVWEQAIGGAGYDALAALQETSDGGFILGGISYSDPGDRKTSSNYGSGDFWLVKLAPPLPTIVVPTNMVAELTSSAGAIVTFNLGASNTCQPVIPVTASPPSGSIFPIGTNLVTAVAVDALGVTNIATFSVLVRDTTAPSITAPPAVLTNTSPGQCYATNVNLGTPTVSDSSGAFSVTNNAPSQFPKGLTVVTWTARDSSGNTNTATQNVTVQDNSPPSITAPAAVLTNTSPGLCVATNVSLGSPLVTDNCGALTLSNNAPAQFPKGMTVVTWTARDSSGNISMTTQNVTVQDVTPPNINAPPAISTNTSPGSCFASNVNLGTPISSDYCGAVTITNDAPAQFPKGLTIVTWTARDSSGNVSTTPQTITVRDLELPVVVSCPGDLSVNNDPGQCGAVVTWTPPQATDNCTVTNLITNHQPGEFFPVGATVVSYAVLDSSGNSNSCNFKVTVRDAEPPSIVNCPTRRDLTLGTNCSLAAPDLRAEVLATDNCGGQIAVTQTPLPGAMLSLGTNLITLVALDTQSNAASCRLELVVNANHPSAVTDGLSTTINAALTLGTSDLLINDTHPDGRSIQGIIGVTANSTNNGQVIFDGHNIFYTPQTNYVGPDAFSYTNMDCAGLIGVGQVLVTVNPIPHSFSLSASAEANSASRIIKIVLRGAPGYTYRLQRTGQFSGSPTAWIDLAVGTADPDGFVLFSDTNAPSPSFYRAKQP